MATSSSNAFEEFYTKFMELVELIDPDHYQQLMAMLPHTRDYVIIKALDFFSTTGLADAIAREDIPVLTSIALECGVSEEFVRSFSGMPDATRREADACEKREKAKVIANDLCKIIERFNS